MEAILSLLDDPDDKIARQQEHEMKMKMMEQEMVIARQNADCLSSAVKLIAEMNQKKDK